MTFVCNWMREHKEVPPGWTVTSARIVGREHLQIVITRAVHEADVAGAGQPTVIIAEAPCEMWWEVCQMNILPGQTADSRVQRW